VTSICYDVASITRARRNAVAEHMLIEVQWTWCSRGSRGRRHRAVGQHEVVAQPVISRCDAGPDLGAYVHVSAAAAALRCLEILGAVDWIRRFRRPVAPWSGVVSLCWMIAGRALGIRACRGLRACRQTCGEGEGNAPARHLPEGRTAAAAPGLRPGSPRRRASPGHRRHATAEPLLVPRLPSAREAGAGRRSAPGLRGPRYDEPECRRDLGAPRPRMRPCGDPRCDRHRFLPRMACRRSRPRPRHQCAPSLAPCPPFQRMASRTLRCRAAPALLRRRRPQAVRNSSRSVAGSPRISHPLGRSGTAPRRVCLSRSSTALPSPAAADPQQRGWGRDSAAALSIRIPAARSPPVQLLPPSPVGKGETPARSRRQLPPRLSVSAPRSSRSVAAGRAAMNSPSAPGPAALQQSPQVVHPMRERQRPPGRSPARRAPCCPPPPAARPPPGLGAEAPPTHQARRGRQAAPRCPAAEVERG